MHNEEITYEELGAELGVGKAYIGMILNGARKPEGARERLEAAVDTIVRRRNGEEAAR
jgi:transcriptional regulator with XRE-family HTH domain